MKSGSGLLGSNGGTVEADETFIGNKPSRGKKPRGGFAHKHAVFALVERDGQARSFHVPNVTAETLKPVIKAHMDKQAHLMTDDAGQYRILGPIYASHNTVAHSLKEYVRGDVHTNTIEGYFGLFKRGVAGAFHHISEQHLQRYMYEFDFRWNHRVKLGYSDIDRYQVALKGIRGKRLTYRRINTPERDITGDVN
jgi:hypothetical protein